jgi:hypothetical protein
VVAIVVSSLLQLAVGAFRPAQVRVVIEGKVDLTQIISDAVDKVAERKFGKLFDDFNSIPIPVAPDEMGGFIKEKRK